MPKVLIVDDSEIDRDIIGRRLGRHGFEPCCAIDAATGISLAATERPDVILMDLSLGEMDGWQAIQRIKENVATAKIPIIVLTSYPLDRDKAKSHDAGCHGFDTKPVDMPRLIGKINACLSGSHTRG